MIPKKISFYFSPKSNCCNGHSSTNEVSDSLSELCRKKWNKKITPHEYQLILEQYKKLDIPLYATTITLKPRYWGMSNKEQYNAVRNILQAYVRERKSHCFYIAELTKQKVIHFHGIDCYHTQGLFHERFKQFGAHNNNDMAYQPIQDIGKYVEYIWKDQMKDVYCAYDDSEAYESNHVKYMGKKFWCQKFKPIYS